ncbi:MAG: hypothetical protein U0987_07525 [Afipia sp.]|nr:hypothetical protein [Afipia sp.]
MTISNTATPENTSEFAHDIAERRNDAAVAFEAEAGLEHRPVRLPYRISGVGLGREHVVAAPEQARRAEIGDGVDQSEEPAGRKRRQHQRKRHLHDALKRCQAEALGGFLERTIDVGERA